MGNDFFDGLGEVFSKTTKELTEKAEIFYEAQKIRNKISSEQRAAEKILMDVGKLVYQRYTEGEEQDEELRELCGKVDLHRSRLNAYKEELAGKKGKKICPSCQKEVDREAAYCPYCGSACPAGKAEAPAEETQTEKKAGEDETAEGAVPEDQTEESEEDILQDKAAEEEVPGDEPV